MHDNDTDNEKVPLMQQLLDNPFLLLFLGVMIPMIVYSLWGVIDILTVPLAKYVALHQNELAFPFRRFQIGKVYRGERAQRGRFREFYQADIDVIGDGSLDILNEAEIPSIIYKTFTALGLKRFKIRVNNRKVLGGLFALLGLERQSADVMRTIGCNPAVDKEAARPRVGYRICRLDGMEKRYPVMSRGNALAFGCSLHRRGGYVVVIGLVVATQGIAEVVAEDIGRQLHGRCLAIFAYHGEQFGAAQKQFGMAIAIDVVTRLGRSRRQGLQGRLQSQQVVPHGAAQMGQIEPAEEAVPIGIVGLGPVQLFLHGCGALSRRQR